MRPPTMLQMLIGQGRTLVLHTALLQLCRPARSNYETTAFLERLTYFQTLKEQAGEDPWVYDSRDVICAELLFTENQLRGAIAFLKDDLAVLTTKRAMINYKGTIATVTHYLVDLPKLEALLLAMVKADDGGTPPSAKPVDENEGAVGGSRRRASVDSRESPSVESTDAYKETQSLPQSLPQSQKDLPALRSGSALVASLLKRKVRSTLPEKKAMVPDVPVKEEKAAPPAKAKVGPEHQAMVDAIVQACYPEGGVLKSEWGIITRKAKELREAGYTPDQVAEIAADMDADPFWNGKIDAGTLAKYASKWKSKGVRRTKPVKDAAPNSAEEEVTPEMEALLAELRVKEDERFAEMSRKMGVGR